MPNIFGSTFLFALIEVLTLLFSPERRFTNPSLLRVLMFFSVCTTFVSFLLIVLSRETFEVISHNMDYLNDFVVALVDSLLVSTVVRSPAIHPGRGGIARGKQCGVHGKRLAMLATFVPLTLSFLQIALYNGMGIDARGELLGERPAHVLEFVFDCVGAGINFWFCLDSKMLAEELTRQIMLAPDEVVVVIDPSSTTSVHTAAECGLSPHTRPGLPRNAHSHSHGGCEHIHDHSHDDGCSHGHEHCCEHDHAPAARQNPLTELLLPPALKADSR